MTKNNIDIKVTAISKGVKLYQIPSKMGIGLSTFERMMRNDLTDKQKQQILNAICEIASENNSM